MGWKDKLNEYASKKGFDTLFSHFDKDNSGSLSDNELSKFLTTAVKLAGGSFEVNQQQAHLIMKAADKDGNGQLSKEEVHKIYQEFVQNITKYIPHQ